MEAGPRGLGGRKMQIGEVEGVWSVLGVWDAQELECRGGAYREPKGLGSLIVKGRAGGPRAGIWGMLGFSMLKIQEDGDTGVHGNSERTGVPTWYGERGA